MMTRPAFHPVAFALTWPALGGVKPLPDIFPKATGPGIIPFRDPQQAITWLRLVEAAGPVGLLTQYRGQVARWTATCHPICGWGCMPL